MCAYYFNMYIYNNHVQTFILCRHIDNVLVCNNIVECTAVRRCSLIVAIYLY